MLVLLAGCPFVFGPPDLSRVDQGVPDRSDPDTDTHDSATTPIIKTSPGGTSSTTPTGSPPVIGSLTVEPDVDGFLFQAVVLDPDGDLDGGSLEVQGPGPSVRYQYPQDVNLSQDLARFIVASDQPCQPWSTSFSLTAYDAAGHASPATKVDTEGIGLGSVKDVTYPNSLDLGSLDPQQQLVLCASLDGVHDTDIYTFDVNGGGAMTMRASWDSSTNVDLNLWDRANNQVPVAVGWSTLEPENIERFAFQDNHVYDLVIYYYDQPSSSDPYAISFVPDP